MTPKQHVSPRYANYQEFDDDRKDWQDKMKALAEKPEGERQRGILSSTEDLPRNTECADNRFSLSSQKPRRSHMSNQSKSLMQSLSKLAITALPMILVLPMLALGFVLGLAWLGIEAGFLFGARFDSWTQQFRTAGEATKEVPDGR